MTLVSGAKGHSEVWIHIESNTFLDTVQPELSSAIKMAFLATFLAVVTGYIAVFLLQFANNWRQLRQVPGPLLAGMTNFWRAWYQYNGRLRGKLVELHKKHGHIVRYGTRSVSVSDPKAINIIYGTRQGFATVRPAAELLPDGRRASQC